MARSKSIVLIGFMGTGKTHTARRLARDAGMELIEIDRQIEKMEGMPISKIFAQQGEPYFRELESRVLRALAPARSAVIDTGGGVAGSAGNRAALKALGTVIWLRSTPGMILKRVGDAASRPLLAGGAREDKIRALLEEREPHYREAADYEIDSSRASIANIVEQIKTIAKKEGIL